MGPETLAQVLRPLQGIFNPADFPNLLVGLGVSDDAAVYRINDTTAVILTTDFFTPVVDDPYDFGAAAAANAMSDVYAMGGEVLMALNICGFPPDLPPEVVSEILRGGAEKLREGGGVLAGGHTIDDKEPKYGMAVLGIIHPDQVMTKAAAHPGDILILTKKLGVGIITTAFKGGQAAPEHIAAATESMKKLNREAAHIFRDLGVTAVTDITGFALLGHGYEMAEKSGVQLVFDYKSLPFLDGARKYADLWLFPGGACNNQNCYLENVTFPEGLSEDLRMLMFTPETSGGLLAAVQPDKMAQLAECFEQAGHPYWIVGEVRAGEGILVK
ncbi:MAG: selenide, water dikinase SelD [Anaerolineales bacterium]|nr:selenide, water dikinase SelD [Anaerolineales bacterium]